MQPKNVSAVPQLYISRDFPTIHVFYHANCLDGFTAAYAVWNGLRGYERNPPDQQDRPVYFHPADYGSPMPTGIKEGHCVIAVDFSFSPEVIGYLLDVIKVKSVFIYDHHESAVKKLTTNPGRPYTVLPPDNSLHATVSRIVDATGLCMRLDMTQSGAMLAWNAFSLRPAPVLVRHVQDRDLWRFQIPNTHAFIAYLNTLKPTFAIWTRLAEIASPRSPAYQRHLKIGEAVLATNARHVDYLLSLGFTRWAFRPKFVTLPMFNAPKPFVSDLLDKFIKENSGVLAAGAYYDGADGRFISLRSKTPNFNVATIAESYGGGGHSQAAGFTAPHREWNGEMSL